MVLKKFRICWTAYYTIRIWTYFALCTYAKKSLIEWWNCVRIFCKFCPRRSHNIITFFWSSILIFIHYHFHDISSFCINLRVFLRRPQISSRSPIRIPVTVSKEADFTKKFHPKVLFTHRCRWQNFQPSLLRLIDRLYTVIHKVQKTRMKVLPSGTVGE